MHISIKNHRNLQLESLLDDIILKHIQRLKNQERFHLLLSHLQWFGYARYSANDFKLIADYGRLGIKTEDSRIFNCYGKQFLTDNYFLNGIRFFDITNGKHLHWNTHTTNNEPINTAKYHSYEIRVRIKKFSKNYGWFCFNYILYFVYYLQPLIVWLFTRFRKRNFNGHW